MAFVRIAALGASSSLPWMPAKVGSPLKTDFNRAIPAGAFMRLRPGGGERVWSRRGAIGGTVAMLPTEKGCTGSPKEAGP
jgi:hypothetical protein